MSKKKIVKYTDEQKRELAKHTERRYEANKTQMLTFEDWKCNFLPILYDKPGDFDVQRIDYKSPIKICKDTAELLRLLNENASEISRIKETASDSEKDLLLTQYFKRLFVPDLVIQPRENGFTVPGERKDDDQTIAVDVPVWFSSSLKGINLRMGYANMDSAKPGAMRLDDSTVHGMLGGATGAGKSVALHTIITSLLHEYAPWEVQCYLLDLKIVELSKYVNRIKTPHVKFVGATGATEYVMSVLDTLRKEMNDRNTLFTEVGTENIKGFREKFGLVMPRVVLIVDEFVQLFENLKDAEQQGSTDTEEQRKTINSAISAIARLGRSTGVHMLLSSQNMEGTLDDQTVGQFKGGASVYASAPVSKNLIGNDAAVRIVGKGKGIVTSNKQANEDESMNVPTRIPYISSDVSEEALARGELPYLQKTLVHLKGLADSVGWDKPANYYNENTEISYTYFKDDLKYAEHRAANPDLGDPIRDSEFKRNNTRVVVLGRPVRYTPTGIAYIDLQKASGNSIIVGATDEADKLYIMQLLMENLKGIDTRPVDPDDPDPDYTHVFILGDQTTYKMMQVSNTIGPHKAIRKKRLPQEIYGLFNERRNMNNMYTVMLDACSGVWDSSTVLYEILSDAGVDITNGFMDVIVEVVDILINTPPDEDTDFDLEAMLREKAEYDDFRIERYYDIIESSIITAANLAGATDNFTRDFDVKALKPKIIWFIGFDKMEDMGDIDTKQLYKELINDGPEYGFHSIITASFWDKIAGVLDNVEYILERANKNFFMELGLSPRININKNSIQLITRQTKQQMAISKYRIEK